MEASAPRREVMERWERFEDDGVELEGPNINFRNDSSRAVVCNGICKGGWPLGLAPWEQLKEERVRK
jgi:hypothetical protein